jgi:hypothetical protein
METINGIELTAVFEPAEKYNRNYLKMNFCMVKT